jgi:hypothetical protein
MTGPITIARLRNLPSRLTSTSGRETGRRAPLSGPLSPRFTPPSPSLLPPRSGRPLQAAPEPTSLAPSSRPAAPRHFGGSCAPPLSPIGLTAADPFAGGEVSRAAWRVRSPGTLTCTRSPAVRAALDAGPEAYHNRVAVWWGTLCTFPRSCRRGPGVRVEPDRGLLSQRCR